MKPADDVNEPAASSELPELPGMRSWNAVYLSVLLALVLWISLLTLLTRHYH